MVAQVLEQSRASDPLYELFNRYLGSSAQQDKIWVHVLTSLAEHLGVKGQVVMNAHPDRSQRTMVGGEKYLEERRHPHRLIRCRRRQCAGSERPAVIK